MVGYIRKAASARQIPILFQFRYAEGVDHVLLVLGIVLAFALGAMTPLQSIIFGSLTTGLIEGQANWTNNTFDFEVFASQTVSQIMNYVYLGIACLLLGYAVVRYYLACFTALRTDFRWRVGIHRASDKFTG